ncbi:MAG: hypothetical protein QNJ72_03760 [Pleurocapsa sp. MO_226.B13]|nr:hypothetical protein [Pleurocapsa sp. MO_226.B13]
MKFKTPSPIGIFIGTLLLVIFVQQPAMAYVGPGTGIAALGALIAIVVGVIVALFGFLWYPLKRMLKKREQAASKEANETEGEKI